MDEEQPEDIEVDFYVMGQYKGKRRVGKNSVAGLAATGNLVGAMRKVAEMQEEVKRIAGMDESRLAEIEARVNEATPGPWMRGLGNECREVTVRLGPKIAEVYGPRDGMFIAHARTDVPDLIAEVRRYRAEIERVATFLAVHHFPGYEMGDVVYNDEPKEK